MGARMEKKGTVTSASRVRAVVCVHANGAKTRTRVWPVILGFEGNSQPLPVVPRPEFRSPG